MVILKCKVCGGDLKIDKEMSVAKCLFCESIMTLPSVLDEKRANMFNRANHHRMRGDFDQAWAAYERILYEYGEDAEAHWGLALCRYGIEYVADSQTGERKPTCHRLQDSSILRDADYQVAMDRADEEARVVYESEAKRIDAIHREILAISKNEKPFDVFICYKEKDAAGNRTKDSVLAQEIYEALNAKRLRTFFARITLEAKLGSAYEPYIYAALSSAQVMVVVGTSPENLNAIWVKNEWSRFLLMMRKDKSKSLIPVYAGMDAYDLPEQLAVTQAQDASKIGFLQDLVHGIKKILGHGNGDGTEETDQNGYAATEPLLKRAFMFLDDGNFNKAQQYFDRVLDVAPENAMAYVGQLCVEFGVCKEELLAGVTKPISHSPNYKRAICFADNDLHERLEGYARENLYLVLLNLIKAREKAKRREEEYIKAQEAKRREEERLRTQRQEAKRKEEDQRRLEERQALALVRRRKAGKAVGILAILGICGALLYLLFGTEYYHQETPTNIWEGYIILFSPLAISALIISLICAICGLIDEAQDGAIPTMMGAGSIYLILFMIRLSQDPSAISPSPWIFWTLGLILCYIITAITLLPSFLVLFIAMKLRKKST